MIEIRSIKPGEIGCAKAVMDAVFKELWEVSYAYIQASYDPFDDIEDMQRHYFENKGIFLVLIYNEKIIGTGGINRHNDFTATMKRVWLLKEYRGRGWGRKLVEALLDFAQHEGYQQVCLTIATPNQQPEALGLYKSLGFLPVHQDAEESGPLHMELVLGEGKESQL